jgi:hypothetical protein
MFRLIGIQPVFSEIRENAIVGHFWGEFDLKAGVQVDAFIVPDVIFDWRTAAKSLRGLPVTLALLEIRECIVRRVLPELDAEVHRLFPDIEVELSLSDPSRYGRAPATFSIEQSARMAREVENPSTEKG